MPVDSEKKSLARYYRGRYDRFMSLMKWVSFLPPLRNAVGAVLPGAQIYVFGSALKGELTASSDVDILIVSPKAKGYERHRLASKIEADLEGKLQQRIFELHLVEPSDLEWYTKHAKELTPLESLAPTNRRS